jgi:hypothetical protein
MDTGWPGPLMGFSGSRPGQEMERAWAWAELGCGQRTREAERGWRRGVWGAKLDFRTMGRKQKRAKTEEENESFFHFQNYIFCEKNNLEITRYFIKGTKKILKIPKIPGKFPKAHWDTNNPNKVFGSQEKYFRAF